MSFQSPRAKEVKMFGCPYEPSLRDALSDPIIRTVMSADHVDAAALETSLRKTAAKIAPCSVRTAARKAD